LCTRAHEEEQRGNAIYRIIIRRRAAWARRRSAHAHTHMPDRTDGRVGRVGFADPVLAAHHHHNNASLPHLSLDLLITATNGPLRRLYMPNRPSTGIFVDVPLVVEVEPTASAGSMSIPASFRATTVIRAPPADSGPRAMERHCSLCKGLWRLPPNRWQRCVCRGKRHVAQHKEGGIRRTESSRCYGMRDAVTT